MLISLPTKQFHIVHCLNLYCKFQVSFFIFLPREDNDDYHIILAFTFLQRLPTSNLEVQSKKRQHLKSLLPIIYILSKYSPLSPNCTQSHKSPWSCVLLSFFACFGILCYLVSLLYSFSFFFFFLYLRTTTIWFKLNVILCRASTITWCHILCAQQMPLSDMASNCS